MVADIIFKQVLFTNDGCSNFMAIYAHIVLQIVLL